MPVIAIQGIRGGVGASAVTAGLAWALQSLGERVLVVDASPSNLLRLHFNVPFDDGRGWAEAGQAGRPWQQAALRYLPGLDLLPFGHSDTGTLPDVAALARAGHYQWVLLDTPSGSDPLAWQALAQADRLLRVLAPDANCHARLHQQPTAPQSVLLVNQFSPTSQLQQDLLLLWQHSLTGLVPVTLHRDEAVSEALAAKQPVGEYRPQSLAANEMVVLANWCLINLKGGTA